MGDGEGEASSKPTGKPPGKPQRTNPQSQQSAAPLKPIPGWYPNPSGQPGQRYWDGYAWHDAVPARPGPVAPKPPTNWKALGIIAGAVAALIVVASIIGGLQGGGRDSTAPPGSLVIPSASLTLSGKELQDAEFMALLIKWANRDGYPVGDRDTLIAAGAAACASMDRGETLISASADLMHSFGLPGKQAGAVGTAAVEVYCPEHTP
jgi:hypothetical protein